VTIEAPFDAFRADVHDAWIDENAHMNVGYYGVVFDGATDAWLNHLGLSKDFKNARNTTTFTLESHMMYLREVRSGAALRFTTQLLAHDAKRIHYFHAMHHADEGYLAATCELMTLHVSRETRRSTPMVAEIQQRLSELFEAHSKLPQPPQVGRVMGVTSGRAQ